MLFRSSFSDSLSAGGLALKQSAYLDTYKNRRAIGNTLFMTPTYGYVVRNYVSEDMLQSKLMSYNVTYALANNEDVAVANMR